MSRNISRLIPRADDVLQLQPEELGEVILQLLNDEPSSCFDRVSLQLELAFGSSGNATQVLEAVGEALNWLEREGLLATRPAAPHETPAFVTPREVLFVTRRGSSLPTRSDISAFRRSTLLPANLLHPIIAQRAQSAFLRREYDTSVFAAFKAVEVEVRRAAGLPSSVIGVQLMTAAFHKSTGPLTSMDDAEAEREAIRNIFAGAIGYCKNPQSHRDDPVEPEDACHLLMFASYLLRIVDIRVANRALQAQRKS